ncbi:alpha/beta hydrolase family protein [Ktedonospora formicarum]|uniref:Alpha/beta hydrolase n=1 Tax=Ktedonospora formicarum TaxID=2778364 RepID=A0A8J3ICM3_9CHLR|nr:hypothetical protein [Ktedonospora formicarum]GHO50242.1 hypothetical protein KSX_84050 [Ktedonospora formicarum]
MHTEAQEHRSDAWSDDNSSSTSSTQHKRRKHAAFGMVLARALLLGIFVISLLTSLTPWGQAAARASFILPSLLLASEPLPLQVAGEPITHTQQAVPAKHGTLYLDIYAPTTTPLFAKERQGILLLPGVGDQRQVPQLINLSQTLARSGLVVMNMTTSTLLQDTVTAQDIDDVVQAFQLLVARPELQGQHCGMIAFSAGVPLVTAAAANQYIRARVAYVTAFGGYYNAETLLETFGRRAVSFDGQTSPWQPTAYALEVLTNVTTETLPENERTMVRQALGPYGTPLTSAELEQLSSPARAIYALLGGKEPGRVVQNMAALTPEMRSQLRGLSPVPILKMCARPFTCFMTATMPSCHLPRHAPLIEIYHTSIIPMNTLSFISSTTLRYARIYRSCRSLAMELNSLTYLFKSSRPRRSDFI